MNDQTVPDVPAAGGRNTAKTPRDYSPAELSELRQILNSRSRLLTRIEVAALGGYGCAETIKRAERCGLRVLKINPRVTRYRPEDVAAYFDAALVT